MVSNGHKGKLGERTMGPDIPPPQAEFREALKVVETGLDHLGRTSVRCKEGGGVCASEGVGRMIEHSLSEEAAVNVHQG